MNARKCFIDTNIFLRVIVRDHPTQTTECERIIEALREGRMEAMTCHLVLAELVWTCLRFYKLPKKDVVRLVRGVASMPHLSIVDDFDTLRALASYEAHNVKFVDAMIASHTFLVRAHGLILSYDADFDALGIPRVEPAAFFSTK